MKKKGRKKPMRKIKRYSDIRAEKKRLLNRQRELEKEIRHSWTELKSGFSSHPFTRTRPHEEESGTGTPSGGFWSAALDYGTAFVRQQVAARAGRSAEARVAEGLDKLTDRLKDWLQRRKRRR
jgi:hypothetical protein